MLCDVPPPLGSLSRALQREDLDYSLVKALITDTISTITNLKQFPGEYFSSLDTVLTNLKQFNIPLPSSSQLHYFKENIYLDAVIQHLTNRFPDIHLLEVF